MPPPVEYSFKKKTSTIWEWRIVVIRSSWSRLHRIVSVQVTDSSNFCVSSDAHNEGFSIFCNTQENTEPCSSPTNIGGSLSFLHLRLWWTKVPILTDGASDNNLFSRWLHRNRDCKRGSSLRTKGRTAPARLSCPWFAEASIVILLGTRKAMWRSDGTAGRELECSSRISAKGS